MSQIQEAIEIREQGGPNKSSRVDLNMQFRLHPKGKLRKYNYSIDPGTAFSREKLNVRVGSAALGRSVYRDKVTYYINSKDHTNRITKSMASITPDAELMDRFAKGKAMQNGEFWTCYFYSKIEPYYNDWLEATDNPRLNLNIREWHKELKEKSPLDDDSIEQFELANKTTVEAISNILPHQHRSLEINENAIILDPLNYESHEARLKAIVSFAIAWLKEQDKDSKAKMRKLANDPQAAENEKLRVQNQMMAKELMRLKKKPVIDKEHEEAKESLKKQAVRKQENKSKIDFKTVEASGPTPQGVK